MPDGAGVGAVPGSPLSPALSPASQGKGRIRTRSGRRGALDWLPSPAQFAGEGLGMGGPGPSAEPS
jgi:hypothetical protein